MYYLRSWWYGTPDQKGTDGADKKAPVAVPPANQKAKAGTHDPNYQTLAGLDGDFFGADKSKKAVSAKPVAPANTRAKAGTFDPNYQTLCGLEGNCFGTDKKK